MQQCMSLCLRVYVEKSYMVRLQKYGGIGRGMDELDNQA